MVRAAALPARTPLDDIEREVREQLHVDLVLHCDPIVTDDAESNALRARVMEFLTARDPRLSIHDFRMVRGTGHTNVIFDLVVPFDLVPQADAIRQELEQALRADGGKYYAIITIDAAAFNTPHT